ncbi:type II CAAX prenyl endopeptidase Rce1 family protein [Candidatus Leptofilum sp.]|uniref:CPBP family glutamic-type intramembrane protease n=1 Tax=Candidatus Leptofilum sp. TaxID=3241576 RepID=UPI003B59D6A1
MAKKSKLQRSNQQNELAARTTLPVVFRIIIILLLPLAFTLILGGRQGSNAPILGGVGVASWFLGLFWYGLPGLGLRGGRPLFAGIGFATLGWLAFLLFRFTFIALNLDATESGRSFIYLLLFEAFAMQLWAYGLLFRSLAEWRGGLTAAVGSGVAFGAVAFVLFQEAYANDLPSLLYFMVWGVFYGLIRLRTGSFLGTLLIQTLHSFSVWVALGPLPVLTPADRLPTVYLLSGLVYLIVIWRLWPKEEADYRI